MLPAVVAGLRPMEDADVNLRDLCTWYNWQFIQGKVISIQANQNTITVVEKSLNKINLHYELLSMDVGSTVHPVPGMSPSNDGLPMVIATRPISRLPSAVESFENIVRNDPPNQAPREVIVMGDGAAGFELACALRARFSKNLSNHINITMCGRSSSKLTQQFGTSLGKLAKNCMASRSIKYVSTKTRVDYAQGIIYFEDHSKPFDLCLLATGAAAHSWLKDSSDLELNPQGFILVDKTLRTAEYRNVFAAGDCCSFLHSPRFPPKAGVYAVRMGPILTHNLTTALTNAAEDKYREFVPQKHFLTLLSLGDGTAIGSKYFVSFSGHWVYSFKSYIDSKWQDSFKKFIPDKKNAGKRNGSIGDDVFAGNPTEGAAALVGANDTASNDEFETQLAVLRRMDKDEEFRSSLVQLVNGD